MNLPVTFTLAACFALMMTVLSLLVSLNRRRLSVVYGDGDDTTLKRAIRAHGNFTEYAPLLLALVLLLELATQPDWLVGGAAVTFLACRVFHAVGMVMSKGLPLRAAAMIGQHVACVGCALWLLKLAILGN